MLSSRPAFAYVVAVDGAVITLNLRDSHRGSSAVVSGGVAPILSIGSHFGIKHGGTVLVAELTSLTFAEPKEAHRARVGTSVAGDDPLRQVVARIAGVLEVGRDKGENRTEFRPGSLATPALGAAAFALAPEESELIASYRGEGAIRVGDAVRPRVPIFAEVDRLLSRHVVVTGATGQGKSCLTAAILQELHRTYPGMRCIVFDVNGEYTKAFSEIPKGAEEDESQWKIKPGVRVTRIGSNSGAKAPKEVGWYLLPYYALGRNGLEALLLPSERVQRPALRFALNSLPHVHWDATALGVRVEGEADVTLFDDCRAGPAEKAQKSITKLHDSYRKVTGWAAKWPPMKALAPLSADFVCVQPSRDGPKRDGFNYGHVASLVRRIQIASTDKGFCKVVDPEGGGPVTGTDPFNEASAEILKKVFGLSKAGPTNEWRIHVVDLRLAPHDLLPVLLGALLQNLLDHIFQVGPEKNPPTMLVLEEAHHYLRRSPSDSEESSQAELLAYERLAKEGRKFGISLWLSTQRPSELSSTVLAQCGSWFCLRLASKPDLDRVRSASEWADDRLVTRIASLPRQEALAFGSAFAVPVHIRLPTANPTPQSHDPKFHEAWSKVPPAKLVEESKPAGPSPGR